MENSWRLSRADLSGLVAFIAAGGLAGCEPWHIFDMPLAPAIIPLILFIGLCIAAPFFPGWSFFFPITSRGSRTRMAVSLSFDDGPFAETTPALLELLKKHGVKASFFVVGKRAGVNTKELLQIRNDGHEIGNHSMNHDALLMLRSANRIEKEIAQCQELLYNQGIRPLVFRPPIGITNPRLSPVLAKLGLRCVCFSCRPLDFANRYVKELAKRTLSKVRPGDILLLHDCPPNSESIEYWLLEIEKVIVGLRKQGLEIVPLSELIGKPVEIRDALATAS